MKRSDYIENYYKNLVQQLSEHVYLLEKKLSKKKAELKKKKKLDPVGREDVDVDNDGKPNTKSDKYIKHRREVIKNAMEKKTKKGTMKEGTIVGNDLMHYGGFPRINEINEEELRSDIDPEHREWYEKKVKLSKAFTDAKKSGNQEKIKAARRAYDEHSRNVPKRKEPLKSKSDYGTYHPNTNIDTSREGT
jgi:hypothetical protein